MKKKQTEEPNLITIDHVRKFKIGTRYITAIKEVYKYVKVDHGIVGKIDGKTVRYTDYRWIRWM